MTIRRRGFIAGATALAAPAVRAQSAQVLRFVPQADLPVVDPHFNANFVTRNHAYMVFDTLYGVDARGVVQPQMAAGHTVEDGGLTWTITLRDGLRFHDGTPVLSRDCVASLRRWTGRDVYARSSFEVVEELSAPSDRVLRFRLKRPFRLLADLLGKPSPAAPAIMPERLAALPVTQEVPEVTGSGPYRYVAAERVPGARNIYHRFEGYVPRAGMAEGTAGPKVAYFDRVEWLTIPDGGTAAAALQAGEVDWIEQPVSDLLPGLRRIPSVTVDVLDTAGLLGLLRMNQLVAPFDKPAVRRALLGAFSIDDMMAAASGDDMALRIDGSGFFHPASPQGTKAGTEAVTSPRDLVAVRAALAQAGYAGELVRILSPGDLPALNAMCEVAFDTMKRLGMNVEFVTLEWAALSPRLNSRNPVAQGGWSVTTNYAPGFNAMTPAAHGFLRGNGSNALFGWPDSPDIEAMRQAWIAAEDPAEQRRLMERLQRQAFQDVPYIPLGGFVFATAYRRNLTGFLKGPLPLFHSVRRV